MAQTLHIIHVMSAKKKTTTLLFRICSSFWFHLCLSCRTWPLVSGGRFKHCHTSLTASLKRRPRPHPPYIDIKTESRLSPLGQSIRQQRLWNGWRSSAQSKKKKKKKNVLFSSVFLSVSFQHVCPYFVQVTSPNGMKLRACGHELSFWT